MKELGPWRRNSIVRLVSGWQSIRWIFYLRWETWRQRLLKLAQENGGRGSREFYHFSGEDRDGLYQTLSAHLKPGDCVLLKGSNSMKLGQVAARLLEKQEK